MLVKMRKILIIIFLMSTVLLVACSKQRSTDLTTKTYEELCKSNGDVWMEMEATMNGQMISEQKCFGCMIKNNHLCGSEEYVNYINSLQ